MDAKLAGITLEEIDIGCFFYPLHGGDQDEAMMVKHVWQKHVLRKLKKMSSLVTKKIADSAENKVMIAKQMILEEDV